MAPKGKLTAALFEERYGRLVAEQYAEYTTARTLRVALSTHRPSIIVTDGMLKLWLQKYRVPADAVQVSSVAELVEKYGDILPGIAAENPTAYRLQRALKGCVPPVYVSDAVLKQWLQRYFDAVPINSAGHLELNYGDRIREHPDAATMEAADLRVWLRTVLKVDASERTCQTWRVRSWSTAERLMSIYDIEATIGDRLRLPQYKEQFAEAYYDSLVVSLSEGQPPVHLAEPSLLRQWYAKYHPDSGPLRIPNAEHLELILGDDLRKYYGDLNDRVLHTALRQRIKPVLLDRRVVRTWIDQYRPKPVSRERPAGAMKRPNRYYFHIYYS